MLESNIEGREVKDRSRSCWGGGPCVDLCRIRVIQDVAGSLCLDECWWMGGVIVVF
jgi:hypothetical protein